MPFTRAGRIGHHFCKCRNKSLNLVQSLTLTLKALQLNALVWAQGVTQIVLVRDISFGHIQEMVVKIIPKW